MGKNKRTLEELEFDEASSSSSSDESEEEEQSNSNSSSSQEKGENSAKGGSDDSSQSSSSTSDDDNDNDDASSSEDDESKEDEEQKPQQNDNKNADDDDDMGDDIDEDKNDEDEDLPLHERIRKREQKGLKMQKIRERKSLALKVAGERLANFKKRKQDNNDGGDGSTSKGKSNNTEQPHTQKKKKSKHAPTEMSSKRSDFYRRGGALAKLNESGVGVEIGAHRYKPLDPRTSNLHGHFNEEQFEKNYAFLDVIRNKEISDLKKRIRALKTTGKKGNTMRKRLGITGGVGSLEEDQERLRSLRQQKAEFERRRIGRQAKHAVKKKISDDVAEGRGVYFLKRKEKRRLEMEARLEEIRKRGGDKAVDKAVEKRRKKNKSRDANRFV